MKRRNPNFHGTEATRFHRHRFVCEHTPSHFVQRRYGRGQSGGQVRDDRRVIYDPARDARRGADVVDAPAPAPAVVEEPASETVSGAKKRLRDDDDEESEDD